MKYKWSDFADALPYMLLEYVDKADRKSLQWIWQILTDYDLTEYHNELQKTRVQIRLLASVEIVNDCTALIREDNYEFDISAWANEIGVSTFRVAQLAGDNFEADEEHEEEDLFQLALLELTGSARKKIAAILYGQFEDRLALARHIGRIYESDSEEEQSQEEIEALIRIYGQPRMPLHVQQYWTWVDGGMPRRS